MKTTAGSICEDIKKEIKQQEDYMKQLWSDERCGYLMHIKGIKENLIMLRKDLRYYSTKFKETDTIEIGSI